DLVDLALEEAGRPGARSGSDPEGSIAGKDVSGGRVRQHLGTTAGEHGGRGPVDVQLQLVGTRVLPERRNDVVPLVARRLGVEVHVGLQRRQGAAAELDLRLCERRARADEAEGEPRVPLRLKRTDDRRLYVGSQV